VSTAMARSGGRCPAGCSRGTCCSRQYDRDQADATILRRAATFLREDPGRARYAGLSCDQDAVALAALLDVLVTEIAHLHSGVRWQAVESCRVVLGETMANPRIRRTRRR
jgi:hypothetical protein